MGEDTAFMLQTFFNNDGSEMTTGGGRRSSSHTLAKDLRIEEDTIVLVDSEGS